MHKWHRQSIRHGPNMYMWPNTNNRSLPTALRMRTRPPRVSFCTGHGQNNWLEMSRFLDICARNSRLSNGYCKCISIHFGHYSHTTHGPNTGRRCLRGEYTIADNLARTILPRTRMTIAHLPINIALCQMGNSDT